MTRSLKNLFSREAWHHALRRGETIFPAYGGLYVESTKHTDALQAQIQEKWPSATQGKAYRRLTLRTKRRAESPRVAVLINAVGRFGNSVIQVVNAGFLAKHLHARDTLYFRFDAIRQTPFEIEEDISYLQIPLWGKHRNAPDIIWRTDAIYRGGLVFDPCEPLARSIAVALRRAIGFPHVDNTPEDYLVIHLRGGDIFGGNPHPDYGQPPLAFYFRVLEDRPWAGVTLISEDEANPCLRGIIDWCSIRSTPVLVRGKASLSEAVELLGTATSVVLSRGSFGPAALFLNPRRRTVFFFGEEFHPILCFQGTELYRVPDLTEEYSTKVMAGNWLNDPIQRSLMISLPKESLASPERVENS